MTGLGFIQENMDLLTESLSSSVAIQVRIKFQEFCTIEIVIRNWRK